MSASMAGTGSGQRRLLPLLLITSGSVLLGANLRLLPGDAPHALLHLWPVLLVLIGIELVVGRSAPGRALGLQASVLALAVVLAVIAPAWVIAGAMPGASAAAGWHEHLRR